MYIPPGFSTIFPYFIVDDAEGFIRFLVDGLDAEETGRTARGDGRIANSTVRLGTSTVMVSDASPALPAMRAAYYLYVENADDAMRRAIGQGGVEISPVGDRAYGDRQGGLRDPYGNVWWISQRLVEEPY